MTKIISVINRKGGVGKTTTVANVGGILADKGKKVLLIDLDSQTNLTQSLVKEELRQGNKTLYESMRDETSLPIITIRENLSLVPSSSMLANIDLELESVSVLADLLRPIESNYDYILIDCPPSMGLSVVNALSASTDYIITLTPQVIPLKGLRSLTEVADNIKAQYNKNLNLLGILLTMWDGRKNLSQMVDDALRQQYGEKVFETKIRNNVSLAEAPLYAEEMKDYAPQSNGYKDYLSLTDELLTKFL